MELTMRSTIYSCTSIKKINRDGSFNVPEDCQHGLLF